MRLAGNAERKKSPKSRHMRTIVQLCRAISSQGTYRQSEKKLVKQQQATSSTCPYNMVNFGPLVAEIHPVANFNGFGVLAALLHGSQV